MSESSYGNGRSQKTTEQRATVSGVSSSHPIPIGRSVAIFRQAQPLGPTYIEGRAVIANVTGIPDVYRVKFVGEQRTRTRLVLPEFQSEPEALALGLMKLWHHHALGPLFEDFFPDEIPQLEERAL